MIDDGGHIVRELIENGKLKIKVGMVVIQIQLLTSGKRFIVYVPRARPLVNALS